MQSGTRPTKPSHKDYDYLGNRPKFGAVGIPQFPDFYNADRINWRPNQGIAETEPIAHTAQPVGCTNFSTAYCANNLIGSLKFTPDELEAVSHANARGGADVREQLDVARGLEWFPAYYNVKRNGGLDSFDTIRLAIMEGIAEHRIVTVGSPWYSDFWFVGADGILPMPKEINNPTSWHNHEFFGFLNINGVPHLMCESHQGAGYGDKGLCYWSRELVNAVMGVYGSAAFIPAQPVDSPAKISLPWWQYVQSLARQFYKSWLPYTYGGVMLWDTPAHIRRNVRVMCDAAGLTQRQKNTLCATIHAESGWDSKAVCHNYGLRNGVKTLLSTDNGLCQWNDYWHKDEITPDEATNNPQKAVGLMIAYWKAGLQKQWVGYSSGSYLKYFPVESLLSVAY